MFASKEGELTDENVFLLQKALYVEPLNHPLEPNKFPTDGNEYIHQVRMEEASYYPEVFKKNTEEPPVVCLPEKNVQPKDSSMTLKQWKLSQSKYFSHLAGELQAKKEQLKMKHPSKIFPTIDNEKDWCIFCLGSDIYKNIYSDENPEKTDGTLPLLSIVLYLDQKDILTLLEYMNTWIDVVEMNHDLCRWIYSLLACISKPLDDDCESFLESFYDNLVEKSKVCAESEKDQFHLILAILRNYFCIKMYRVGPDLSQFSKLE